MTGCGRRPRRSDATAVARARPPRRSGRSISARSCRAVAGDDRAALAASGARRTVGPGLRTGGRPRPPSIGSVGGSIARAQLVGRRHRRCDRSRACAIRSVALGALARRCPRRTAPARNVAMRVPSVVGAVCASHVASVVAHLLAGRRSGLPEVRGERLERRSRRARRARAARAATAASTSGLRTRRRSSSASASLRRPPGGNSWRPVSSSHRMIAGRVHVGATVELLAARLLGRHVRDLAVDDAGRGLLELERRRREPEVGQLHLAACTTPGRWAARCRGGRA